MFRLIMLGLLRRLEIVKTFIVVGANGETIVHCVKSMIFGTVTHKGQLIEFRVGATLKHFLGRSYGRNLQTSL